MVRKKILNIGVVSLLVLLSYFNSSAALSETSKLFLSIEKSDYMLGRPIRAELYGVALKTKITDINLSKLNKYFGVVTDYSVNDTNDERWPNQSIQILKFKLYPRYTGKIIIPSLNTNDTKTKEREINVNIGETGKINISSSTKVPYVRQQFILNISIKSDDLSSHLSIREGYKINGFESTPLPFRRIKEKDGTYINKIGWALIALKSGEQKLELPPIEYSVSGVLRKQFYLPHNIINIKPLPSYVPPTLPIGEISLQSQPPYAWLIQSDTLAYWKIKIKGKVNNAYRLPAILRQIKSNSHFQFLPVNSKHLSEISNSNLLSVTNHTIPFKALSSGFLKLPDLTIQYFDPNKGEIKDVIYESSRIFVLGLFWQIILGTFVLYLIYISFDFIYRNAIKFKVSSEKRTQALESLQEIKNTTQIKDSMKLIAEAECWPKNMTISQWGINWKKKYKVNDSFDDLMQKTSSFFYSLETNSDINELGLQLYSLIKNRKRC